MEVKKIYSETPEGEQWKLLLHYSYPNNINKYLNNLGMTDPSTDLVESISAAILQAKEYFEASINRSLQISPLLLYYGTVNLLYGAGCLISGKLHDISNHGLTLLPSNDAIQITDILAKPSSAHNSALYVFSNFYSQDIKVCSVDNWKLSELLSSIPETVEECLGCYQKPTPHVIPVDVTITRNITTEKTDPIWLSRFSDISEGLLSIVGMNEHYLTPQIPREDLIILRPKRSHRFLDNGIYSLNGKKYLALYHDKNGTKLHLTPEIALFIALYIIGNICRYRPNIWNPFVRTDTTGEKLLIDNFIDTARRIIPNLVLNRINNKRVVFVSERQGIRDMLNELSPDDIQELIKEEVRKQLSTQEGSKSEY